MVGSESHLFSIGGQCTIAHGCIFLTHDGGTWVFREQFEYHNVIAYGRITIHDNCFVGAGCILLPGITIGPGSVVGAGPPVTKNVPPGTVVVGNPARVLKTVYEHAKECLERTPEHDVLEYQSNRRPVVERLYPQASQLTRSNDE